MQMRKQAALFDLDGTLIDSALDLGRILNQLLEENGCSPVSIEAMRPSVSAGSAEIVRSGFGFADDDPRIEPLQQELIERYAQQPVCDTQVFDGMRELLAAIREKGLAWGIVTNKITRLTQPIVATMQFDCDCVVCGDTLAVAKPSPQPLLHACELLQVNPTDCVYVGDALGDIQAGKAARMATLIAAYGYIGNANLIDWSADGIVQQPLEVLEWLRKWNV